MLSHGLPWLPHQQYFSWIQTKTNKTINVELRWGEAGEIQDIYKWNIFLAAAHRSSCFYWTCLLRNSFTQFSEPITVTQLYHISITFTALQHGSGRRRLCLEREIVRYLLEELLKLMSAHVIALACSSTIHFIFTWISHFSNGMEPYNVGIWLSLINFILALIRTITSLTKPPLTLLEQPDQPG